MIQIFKRVDFANALIDKFAKKKKIINLQLQSLQKLMWNYVL